MRQALEDVHEEQETKAMSSVSLARNYCCRSSRRALCPDSAPCAGGTPACWHAPQLSKARCLPRSNLSFSKLVWGQACVTAPCIKQQAATTHIHAAGTEGIADRHATPH